MVFVLAMIVTRFAALTAASSISRHFAVDAGAARLQRGDLDTAPRRDRARCVPTLLVADHHERRKAEAPAAFHHLRHAVDVDELVDEFARLLPFTGAGAGTIAIARFMCHR